MNENTFLIVLYGKQIEESSTINNILKFGLLPNSNYVIWNNGPKSIEIHEKDFAFFETQKFKYVETLDNMSLAKIYNEVIKNFKAKRYIFLDDDSSLTKEYIESVHHISVDHVGMPIIYSQGKMINPCINGRVIGNDKFLHEKEMITTIGSGLIIGDCVALNLSKYFGNVFDERFYLYGVDTSFCFRLNRLGMNKNIQIIAGFEHSLSRLNSKEDNLQHFRRKERSNDIALQIRFYHDKRSWVRTLLMLFLSFIKKKILRKPQQYHIITVIKTLFKGKHERE